MVSTSRDTWECGEKGNVFYEVPISYSGRTYDEGKKIRARNVISVILTILKKRLF